MQTHLQIPTSRLRVSGLMAVLFLMPLTMGARGCDRTTVVEPCDPSADGGGACVCEYDGEQYPAGAGFKSSDGCNDCSCQEDGNVICTLRACVAVCGGLGDPGCPDDQYCDYPVDAICGAADGTGVCRVAPEVCPENYEPVCGCNGQTYANACAAASDEVSVAALGACEDAVTCEYAGEQYDVGESFASTDGCNRCTCEPDGSVACTERACLPACGSRGLPACADGQYCDFFATRAECGQADAPGVCAEIPAACTKEYRPVCGCDGETYGNACTAAAAGVSVSREGECAPAAEGCDYDGQHYEVGEGFPSSDGCNTCSCTESGLVACTLRACLPSETCGGLTGAQCDDGFYCKYAADALCGAADATGTCERRPDLCTADYAPVCGCDGETYGNSCEAAAKGVSVQSEGECG